MKKLLFSLIAVVALSSCMVTRTTVGAGPVGNDPGAQVYSSVKQGYVLRGLVPLGSKQVKTPADCNYQVKTSHKFLDGVITGITLGIYSQQTIEVLIKK